MGCVAYALPEWFDGFGDDITSNWDLVTVFRVLWTLGPSALAFSLIAVRHLARRWVLNELLRPDHDAYNEAWRDMVAGGGNEEEAAVAWRAGLIQAAAAAAALEPPGPSSVVLQRLSRRSKGPAGRASATQGDGIESWLSWPAVTCMEQLFGQAAAASVYLRHKARAWALISDGCFWVVPAVDPSAPAQLRRWIDIAAEPGVWRVRWTRRKPAARALEKLQRAYGGEAARLGDVCRERLVFEGPGQVARCLEAIRADPEARVVRIKDRIGRAGDSTWTAGYR